jgi:hypothetical protein
MIGIGLISLLLLGFADPPLEKTAVAVVDEIGAMLSRKGKTYPYFVEYEMGLPAQPRPSGGTGTHRYLAEAADRLYFEETSETFSLKILLELKTLSFGYEEPLGQAICTGPADLAGVKPERWLLLHGFVVLPTAEFDADILSYLRSLLVGSKVLREEQAGDLRTYHLSSRLGPLSVVLGPARVEVSQPAEGKKPAKILLRYAHGDGKPPWFGSVADLSAKVKDPKSTVHRMTTEFKFMDAVKAANPDFNNELVVADTAEQLRLARRHGYLLPDPAVAKIVKATAMSGQLFYELNSGGTTYEISQYPKSSRVQDAEALGPKPRARRKLGDYDISELVDPGTCRIFVFCIKPDVTLMVTAPIGQTLKFQDPALDRIITSFAAPKP